MAEYKDIHGTTVRNSDGNLSGAITGELFYDATNRDFKYQYLNVTTAGAWRPGIAGDWLAKYKDRVYLQ